MKYIFYFLLYNNKHLPFHSLTEIEYVLSIYNII